MLMLWSAIVALGANKTFMLHGWTSTPSAFTTISNLLVTNGGWAPGDIVFGDYSTEPNTRTIEELAYKIASDMQMAYSANGNQPIDFVAHSQGGLILRVILAGRDRNPSRPYDSRGFKPACIRRIITLATPHYGHNRASNPLPSVASEVQRQEMYVGGGFLWDLACDWRDVTKKIPDANFLCVVAMPDADTVNVNAFVNRDDDGIVPIWAAALGACEARYVVRVHAQVIRLFGNWFGLGNAGIEECPGGGNDEVYLLIRDFLGHGTVRSQAQCGLPNPQLPDGTLLVRVFNAYGTPVAYSGNIIAGVLPGATLILYHGQGDWQAAGVEQLGPLAAGPPFARCWHRPQIRTRTGCRMIGSACMAWL
jgi:pimeloyl-ACP methyl ester carboxylesterase